MKTITQKVFFIIGILFFISSLCQATTFYWIGGSGNWSDVTHWSTVSGGAFHVSSIPSPSDDVIFDNNSFGLPSPLVNVDIPSISIQNIQWNVTNANPSFSCQTVILSGALQFGTTTVNSFTSGLLQVGGKITFSEAKINFFTPGRMIVGSDVTVDNSTIFTINPSTVNISGSLLLNNSTISNFTVGTISGLRVGRGGMVVGGTVNWGNSFFGNFSTNTIRVMGDLLFGSSFGNFTYGSLTVFGSFSGGTNAVLNPIFCFDAQTSTLNYGVANFLGTLPGLFIEVKNKPLNGTVTIQNSTGDYTLMAGLSVDRVSFGSSFVRGGTLTVSGNVNLGPNTINARIGITFVTSTATSLKTLATTLNTPTIIINGNAPTTLGTLNTSTLTNNTQTIVGFRTAYVYPPGAISGNNVFDSLIVVPNATALSLAAGQTQSISEYFSFRGTSCNSSILQSNTNGQQAIIHLDKKLSFASDFLSIKDINVVSTGSGFYLGPTSTNAGNNTNVTFTNSSTLLFGSLGRDITTCKESITLKTNPFNGIRNVFWSTGATTPSLLVTTSGQYIVNITFNTGCVYRDTINVQINSNPTLTITGLASVSGFQNGVVYTVSSLPGFDYQWLLPNGGNLASPQGLSTVTVNFQSFEGGYITCKGINSETNCSAITTFSIAKIIPARYSIPSQTIFCGTTTSFCVPITALVPISPNTIGLDFELYYDPTFITATGLAALGPVATSYGNYSLNIAHPGKVVISIFLDNPPINTYMTGIGDVICIGFRLKNNVLPGQLLSTFTSSPILESNYLSTNTVPSVLSGTFNYAKALVGALTFQNTSIRMSGSLLQNPTFIQGLDITTTSTTGNPIFLSNAETFQLFDANTSNLRISRDIIGDATVSPSNCTNTIGVINSTDRLLASQISNGIISNPTIFQLLAADVNLDGKVTSADATLISMRSVNAFNCEFPQSWNYVLDGTGNLVPKPNYSKSIDWLFVDRATLSTPGFANANKNNVPSVPALIPVTGSRTTPCNGLIDQTVAGILLGDVNGNWTTVSGTNIRNEEPNQSAIIQLDEVIYQPNGSIKIPISFETENEFTGLDFSWEYDTLSIAVGGLEVVPSLVSNYRSIYNLSGKGRLLANSFIKQDGILHSQPILFLTLENVRSIIKPEHFSTLKAYINGSPAKVRVVEKQKITETRKIEFETASIFPNPTTGQLTIGINSIEGRYELYDACSHKVLSGTIQPEVDLSSLPSGIYNLILISTAGIKRNFKIVKL